MEAEQVRSIAAEMGMKKADSADRQDAEYYILDNQAITSAKEMAEKSAAQPRKRGRKPKAATDAAAKPARTAKAAKADDVAEAPAESKKRGRKPKAQPADEPTLFDSAENTDKGDNSSTIDSQTKTPVTTDELPILAAEPKRRGRKPKAKAGEEAQPAVVPAEASAAPTTDILTYIAAEEPKPEAITEPQTESEPKSEEKSAPEQQPVSEAKPEKAPSTDNSQPSTLNSQINTPIGKKTFRSSKAKDTSLDVFFPQANTRKFTPRTQRAGEPALVPAPIPAAPVLIEEPKAQPQQLGKRQQQKSARLQRQQVPTAKQQETFAFDNIVNATGVLELMPEGFGFLRSSDYNYLASPDDIYVAQNHIKQYALKSGDVVECTVNPPRDGDKYFPLGKVLRVNGQNPVTVRDRIPFEHLTPLFPEEKFDITSGPMGNISTRIVDMFAPIGKGQRALIVAPPKTGKTILLKDIANAIASNHPDTYIIMLLIDERPEEVTDMARSVNAEVIASTFDEPAERHVKIAGIVLEKAKRLVESGHDVVIMLDSITRLARAYNTVSPASGKILSGGVDANALQKPKRFFGAARNIENGGSLTIIATALTETSSKMDEVIFEEFKGTGNMELQLDRKLSNKRLFPAVDIIASSTRREDLLTNPEILNRMWLLRKFISDMNSIEALEFIKKQMEMTRSNLEILHNMNG